MKSGNISRKGTTRVGHGSFFETQPNPGPKIFAPNPTQLIEVFTLPNQTHRRHSAV